MPVSSNAVQIGSRVNEQSAFLAAIISAPDDDTPRLVYADWLQEHGDDARAEFIRLQCEKAARGWGRRLNGRRPVAELRLREQELLAGPRLETFEHEVNWFHSGNGTDTWRILFRPGWARGFVEEVTCTAADWLAHADAIHWHPEQKVNVPLTYEERQSYACKVCGNSPDEDGWIEHGKGCYTQGEDGGGTSRVELPAQTVPRPCPATAHPVRKVRLTTWTPEDRTKVCRLAVGLDQTGRPYVSVMAELWPGIEFELPCVSAVPPELIITDG